jgi:hypothetical protein
VRAVLNVHTHTHAQLYGAGADAFAAEVAPLGFRCLHVPVEDLTAPTQAQIADSVAFIRACIGALGNFKLVECSNEQCSVNIPLLHSSLLVNNTIHAHYHILVASSFICHRCHSQPIACRWSCTAAPASGARAPCWPAH